MDEKRSSSKSWHVGIQAIREEEPSGMVVVAMATGVNKTAGHRFGQWSEELTSEGERPNIGFIFRLLQSKYGRCVGKMLVDLQDGPRHVGWVFEREDQYDRSEERYLREVWVELRWSHSYYVPC